MNEFFSVFPNGKPASCLEDLKKFSVKELLGKKGPLPFFVVNNQSQSQQLPLDSFMDHTTCCTYKAAFFPSTLKSNLEK